MDPSLDNTPRTEPASIPMETEATEAGAAETEPTETEPALPDTAPSYNRQAEARIIYPDRQPALSALRRKRHLSAIRSSCPGCAPRCSMSRSIPALTFYMSSTA